MTYPPTFTEIYVVSDIHLGGRRDDQENFQIFNRGERLGNLIRHISGQRVGEDVALVLNGDIIDSLAEDDVSGYVASDCETALRMMQHLYQDAAFQPVWQGLAHLVQQPKRHLIFIVGNHDIELSLPVVEYSIRNHLAAANENAQARIHFATHGGGFACRVAGARIFCTHGNEEDAWNLVDYDKLGQLANAMNAARTIEKSKWKPNAGTRLVVDVMNSIKRRYPFVDLLKPEVAAVAAVILALDKNVFKQVDFEDAFPVLRDRIRGGLVTKNLLGAGENDLSAVPSTEIAKEVSQQLLGPNFREAIQNSSRNSAAASEDDLLSAAEKAISEGRSATAMADREGDPETLGAWDIFTGWIGFVSKEEGLRKALKDWLEDDVTFRIDNQDDLYHSMRKRVGDQVDFIITGHTHKPRALELGGNRYYYNCGTWIRTLRLTTEVLDDADAFCELVWPALKSGKLAVLDETIIPGPDGALTPLLFDRTNVVQISAENNSAVGQLLRVTDSDSVGRVKLSPESGTKPFKVG
ncbi:MAG: metallophosphoesterase [Desulfobacterales bacterium]|jgi:UDP-2,3-diacylglucosamine pyrophosphatase LpxH